jgi:lysophospholipase L1-like esterase
MIPPLLLGLSMVFAAPLHAKGLVRYSNSVPLAARASGAAHTIVAFGDSTTAPRQSVRTYSDILRAELPKRGIDAKVINAGVPGNTTADARKRFERDVLAAKPSLVIIQLGSNDSAIDVWKSPPQTEPRVSIAQFGENLEFFVRTLKRRKIIVILMTPNPLRWTPEFKRMYGKSPYQPDSIDGFNVLLVEYVAVVRQIARREKAVLIDVYATFESHGRETGKSVEDLLLDGEHPNNDGHSLIARRLIPLIVDQVRHQSREMQSSSRAAGPG